MNDFENQEKVDAEGVFSKVLRAGRRTYFSMSAKQEQVITT